MCRSQEESVKGKNEIYSAIPLCGLEKNPYNTVLHICRHQNKQMKG